MATLLRKCYSPRRADLSKFDTDMASESDAALDDIAKAISDLDKLIQGLLSSLRDDKTWQRQLKLLLAEADQSLLVMRMTIALEHENSETVQAARNLCQAIRGAAAFGSSSRASAEMKAALRLANQLSQKVSSSLARALCAPS
jgi:hypothetical protein